MSERVGPAGHVVATDINIDWMSGSQPGNVELRRHDIGVDPLPERAFDIVHARAVLTFVPERRSALMRMIAALKPGGWLLVEELVPPVTEALDPSDEPDIEIARKGRRAMVELIRRRGGDPVFARELAGLVKAAGLTEVGAEGYFVPFRTAAVVGLAKANIDQLGAAIVEAGLMSAAELDRYRSAPRTSRLSLSRIYGADFRVGTATTVLTFERTRHEKGARNRCDAGQCAYWLCFYRRRLWSSGAAKTQRRRAARISPHCAWRCFPPGATLPVHAAITKRLFERNGLRIELTEGQDLPVFMAALAKGQYDIAQGVPTLVLIGAEKGLDLQIVSSIQRSSRERPNAVWITKDPSIDSVAQLEGKTIGVPSLTGILTDSMVYLLQRSGVERNEVKFVATPFPTMGDQLEAGRVDAVVATIPFSYRHRSARLSVARRRHRGGRAGCQRRRRRDRNDVGVGRVADVRARAPRNDCGVA